MLGKTHIVNAVAITSIPLVFGVKVNTEYIVFIILVGIGSIFSDIDEPNSLIGRRLKFLSYPINIFFGHRTITHNLLLFSTISLFFYYQDYKYLFAISLGSLIHILQDSLTYQGIKGGLFPLQKLNYHFVLLPRAFRFAVGSLFEYIIFFLSVIFLLLVIYIQSGYYL